MKILKKHIGRTLDYRGCNRAANTILQGVITDVAHGVASIVSNVIREDDGRQEYSAEGFTTRLRVNDARVVEVY